ncbi:MAG: L-threonylcarbamoyladenylate synthase [Cyanobacterium sp. T60_A2020_053]|nr:L-threonylcarbamoyladenylate synthase [Cyanobacterium sp. T60_A2020_053]
MSEIQIKSIDIIPKIISDLHDGEIVALHTDMVYILLANGLNSDACEKIHKLKRWNPRKPLTLLSNQKKLPEYAQLDNNAQILANQFPLPISLIVPHRNNLSEIVTAGHNTIFVSCPDNFTYRLVEKCSFPIVAGTASFGGDFRANNAKVTEQFFGNNVALIIDGGDSKERIRTTLIDCHLPLPTIMNFGLISYDELRLILPHIELPSHLRK